MAYTSCGDPTTLVTCNVEAMNERSATSSTVRVKEHRARLRERGLRPIQIWIPDVRAADFVEEARRQSLAVAASGHAEADQAFIDEISTDVP